MALKVSCMGLGTRSDLLMLAILASSRLTRNGCMALRVPKSVKRQVPVAHKRPKRRQDKDMGDHPYAMSGVLPWLCSSSHLVHFGDARSLFIGVFKHRQPLKGSDLSLVSP